MAGRWQWGRRWGREWGRLSNQAAVANARAAATELGRRRVERAEVETFLRHQRRVHPRFGADRT